MHLHSKDWQSFRLIPDISSESSKYEYFLCYIVSTKRVKCCYFCPIHFVLHIYTFAIFCSPCMYNISLKMTFSFHFQKLVVKPDQLIKRRGKLGLIKVNVDLEGAKEWLSSRLGQEIQVGNTGVGENLKIRAITYAGW